MPDGESQENQNPPTKHPIRSLKDIFGDPPVPSKITEPDPDYVPEVAPKPTSEETQEAMFRETAKRLANEEKDISDLLLEYLELPMSDRKLPRGTTVIKFGNGDIELNSFNENISASTDMGKYVLLLKQAQVRVENSRGDIDSDIQLVVPTQIEIGNKRASAAARYAFDETGNYRKKYSASPLISGDNVSKMTPEDFELAGSVLDGIKSKLMTALGKAPPEPQSSGQ